MNNEMKIITLGDIFANIETEEKAFKFKDYITNLQEKYEEADNDRHKLFEQKEKARELLKEFYDSGSCPLRNISKAYEILNGDDKSE